MRNIIHSVLAIIILVTTTQAMADDKRQAVVVHYADMAHAAYEDSLSSAQQLQQAVNSFIAKPDQTSLKSAKRAWLEARLPYGQTEAFRFGNVNVDDWEGRVNAWPLDEGLLDYIADGYVTSDGNAALGHANVIHNAKKYPNISKKLLQEQLHEAAAEEANVATGYHAIEFLLWGQDLNIPRSSPGQRPVSDYFVNKNCTSGKANKQAKSVCQRRAEYLQVVTDLLVDDLQEMVADWAQGNKTNYRSQLLALDPNVALTRMLVGIGSLSLGELASERIQVALLAQDQEEEHSCFSDNTHIDILTNALGIQNIYLGEYKRVQGKTLSGPSLSTLVAAANTDLDARLRGQLKATMSSIDELKAAAIAGEPFDQQISGSNRAGNKRVKAIVTALQEQTQSIESAAKLLGITELKVDRGSLF